MFEQKDTIMNQIEQLAKLITAMIKKQGSHVLDEQHDVQKNCDDMIRSLTGLSADTEPAIVWSVLNLIDDLDKKTLLATSIFLKYPQYLSLYDELMDSMDMRKLDAKTKELIRYARTRGSD